MVTRKNRYNQTLLEEIANSISHGLGLVLSIIGFKMLEHYEKLLSGRLLDIVYTIDRNYWNGVYSTQLVLKDIVYSNDR